MFPVALRGFHLKTLPCGFSMFRSLCRALLPMPATDISPYNRILTVAHVRLYKGYIRSMDVTPMLEKWKSVTSAWGSLGSRLLKACG